MRKNPPLSTRLISVILVTVYASINIVPVRVHAGENSIAILEYGTGTGSPVSDLWRETREVIENDPLLLVKGDEVIAGILKNWKQESSDRREADRALFLAYRGRVNSIVDEAWEHYFGFRFKEVLVSVKEADGLLGMVSDTALQSEFLFELLLLEAISVREIKNDTSSKPFIRAARLKPDAQLSEEKYSPQIVKAFNKAVKMELSGARAAVSIDGQPSGATVIIDGKGAGVSPLSGYEVTPGTHFLEINLDGYETYRKRISTKDWEATTVNYTLEQSGPAGDPVQHIFGRLKSRDSASLGELIIRTDVGHLLFAAEEDGVLKTWLIGPGGKILDSRTIQAGPESGSSSEEIYSMLIPLRIEREEAAYMESLYLNEPPPRAGYEAAGKKGSPVKWYTLLGGIILISLAAGAAQGEGTSQVEVTW